MNARSYVLNRRASSPVCTASRSTVPPATIPLWFFDETTGLWQQDGIATLEGTGLNRFYTGPVTRNSYWNADRAFETVFVSGCLRDSNNQAVANQIVSTNGTDYSGPAVAVTAADGTFRVDVRGDRFLAPPRPSLHPRAPADARRRPAFVEPRLGISLHLIGDAPRARSPGPAPVREPVLAGSRSAPCCARARGCCGLDGVTTAGPSHATARLLESSGGCAFALPRVCARNPPWRVPCVRAHEERRVPRGTAHATSVALAGGTRASF